MNALADGRMPNSHTAGGFADSSRSDSASFNSANFNSPTQSNTSVHDAPSGAMNTLQSHTHVSSESTARFKARDGRDAESRESNSYGSTSPESEGSESASGDFASPTTDIMLDAQRQASEQSDYIASGAFERDGQSLGDRRDGASRTAASKGENHAEVDAIGKPAPSESRAEERDSDRRSTRSAIPDRDTERSLRPEDRGVHIESIRTLRGPNVHAYMPVLQVTIDIGKYDDMPSDEFPGFTGRLLDWLPGLEKHTCSLDRKGGFVERLRRGTYLAHILEHVAIELQNEIGFNVAYGRARGTDDRGVYNVVIEYAEEIPARECVYTALELTLAAMHNERYDIEDEIERLRDIADRHRLGPSAAAIVNAAKRRDIPVLRLRDTTGLVQLGYGINQKRVSASITSKTSSIAVDICQEKRLTNSMLRSLGLPTPEGDVARTPGEAWRLAKSIGLPVVVKPAAGNQGKGVSVNLSTEDEVRHAFEIADHYGDVLVERFLEGDDYRMLVVNCKLVAAARREPALVTGDGEHTVRELVEITNEDPRRRPGHAGSLTRIEIDDAAMLVLEQQELSPDSVPALGQIVHLRSNSNLSTGGTSTDVTDEVHPDTAHAVEVAAQFLGLDVAGIDVIARDITKPLSESGGIVEVNAAPGLRMHMHPAKGKARDVGSAIVEMLYPNNTPSRIPIIAVTGTNGKTTVTRLIAYMYRTARKTVGMTCTDGTYVNDNRIMSGDCSGPRSAQAILLHPQVEAAVLETARGGILREGLAFDKSMVGVVTNIAADHLGIGGINTVEDLAKVKQVVIESVAPYGYAVLNADDPLVASMRRASQGEVIYFSINESNPVIQEHMGRGGRAVLVSENTIELVMGSNRIDLVDLTNVPFTLEGKLQFQVQNALAATAAAWASELNPTIIAQALMTFQTDAAKVPGRFNVRSINGVEIILDYGHNPAAIRALMQAADAMGKKPTSLIVGLPGDRRDEDLKESIAETTAYVECYYVHDQEDRRGRAENEVPEIMQQVIPEGVAVSVCRDQNEAVHLAWKNIKAGDRLIIIADKVEETLGLLDEIAKEHAAPGDSLVATEPRENAIASLPGQENANEASHLVNGSKEDTEIEELSEDEVAAPAMTTRDGSSPVAAKPPVSSKSKKSTRKTPAELLTNRTLNGNGNGNGHGKGYSPMP